MSDLKGKVAVVTGGARDIGRAVSLKLAKNGAKVVVNYFENRGDANDTVKMIKNNGGDAIAVYADATSLSDLENLASKTKEAFGDKVDILVNVITAPLDAAYKDAPGPPPSRPA